MLLRIRSAVLIAVAVGAFAMLSYTAYWFHVVGELGNRIEAWAEARRAEGWKVEWSDETQAGFPAMAKLRFKDPHIVTPQGNSWRAEFLGVGCSPLDLTLLRFSAPGRHEIVLKDRPPITVTAAHARAETNFDRKGVLEDAGAVLTGLEVEGVGPGPTRVGVLAVTIDPLEVANPKHDTATVVFSLSAQGATLPPIPGLVLDQHVQLAEVSGRIMGPIPPGPAAQAIAKWSADGGTVEIDHIALEWKPVALEADGTLAFDPAMRPVAALSARVRGYGLLMDRLTEARVVDAGTAAAAKVVLQMMSKPDGKGRPAVPVPVTVQDGTLFLGPAKVARLPALGWPPFVIE
ncbi:MAG: DUF2125 domain-containing protein [Solirubrobacterales bacterium]